MTDSTELSPSWKVSTTNPQLIKEFPTFYGTQIFISTFMSLLLFPILRQMNPSHALSPCFFKIQLDITLPTKSKSSKWPLLFSFPHQNSDVPHVQPILALVTLIFGEVYKSFSHSLWNVLQPLLISSLLGPNIFLSNLSHTLRLRSSLNVRDKVSDQSTSKANH